MNIRKTNPAGLAGPFVLLVSFAVYLSTLAPGVTFWDSGELVLGAFSLGLPHPPAYPLFCILGKAFSLIPFGNVAYRVNLMSASFGAGTVYLVYRLVLRLGEGVAHAWWLAAAAALSFAFYGSFWGVSVVTEVYTINSFLLVAVASLLLTYDRTGREAHLHMASLLLGLALSNHQSVLLMMPAYAGYALLAKKNYLRPAPVIKTLFFFGLGYSVVLYMPVRAAAGTTFDLGDPKTLANFGWSIKWPDLVTAAGNILRAWLPRMNGTLLAGALGLAASLAGLSWLARKKGYTLAMAYAALFSFAGIAVLTMGAAEAEKYGLPAKFYIPSVLFSIPVLAEAVFWAARSLSMRSFAQRVLVTVIAALLTVFPVYSYSHNLRAVDESRNFFAFDFASNTLKSVKQDAALFAWGDNGIFPVWYLQGCERYRDDVLFMHSELLTYDWYIEDLNKRLKAKYDITFSPPFRLTNLEGNYPVLRLVLEKVTPTYLDYSAMSRLNVPYDKLWSQGLVHLGLAWQPMPLGAIWDKYVLRGAYDGSTNKFFAAEGILDIYAWEAALWAVQADHSGNPVEALKAYDLSKKLGLNNPAFDKWAAGIGAVRKER